MTKKASKLLPMAATLLSLCLIGADGALAEENAEDAPDLMESNGGGLFPDDSGKLLAYLEGLSDEALMQAFDGLMQEDGFIGASGYEPCLSELLRRDLDTTPAYLQAHYDTLIQREIKPYEKADYTISGAQYNLELLTVLRRAQDKPDPLHIEIEGPDKVEGIGSELPVIRVAIRNVDEDEAAVGFTIGGNYRSGRPARWRIHLEDEDGKAMPVVGRLGMMGGGLVSEGLLEHGKAWQTTLDLRSFIELPPPGKYRLTVLYHNTQIIAGRAHIDGLIVSRSDPITLTIKPIAIVHSKADQETVRALVAELDGKEELKLVAGTYGEWAHDFVAPDSPAGELLGMRLSAVPTLIESLHDKSLTGPKRAWLLGILFSLTSENDPRQRDLFSSKGSALGPYTYWESGWQVWGGREGEPPAGGFSPASKGSVKHGEIDPEAQAELIEAWDAWLKRAEVKEVEDDGA